MDPKGGRALNEKDQKKSDYLLLRTIDELGNPTYDEFMHLLTDVVDYVNEETDVDMPVTYRKGYLAVESDKVGVSMNRLMGRHLEREFHTDQRPDYRVTEEGRDEKLNEAWLERFDISTDYSEAIEEGLEATSDPETF